MSTQPTTIHLVAHFHYDPVWIKDQRTYTREAFDLIHQYLEACRQDPAYHLILSELDYLQPFLAAHGDYRDFIQELAAQGRLYAAGSYCQPNEMLLQGEPLIRNLIYGRCYHERILGLHPTVYLPLDVFGHCLQLPQLLRKAGYRATIWSKDIVGALPICFGLAPDGTTLLQKREPYWFYPETWEALFESISEGVQDQTAQGLTQDLRLMGHDMAAPRAWLTGKSGELAACDPTVTMSTPEKYLDAVMPEVEARRAVFPVSGRDLSCYHSGTLVTRADLKIANRLAENRVLSAEKWATLAALLGAIYPEAALDKAWRQVLFCQHHDGITGCSSDVPYLDMLTSYREALELAAGVEEKARRYTASRVTTNSGKRMAEGASALLVFNPLSWSRTDVCRARVKLEGACAKGFRLVNQHRREVPCQLVRRGADETGAWAELAFLAMEIPSLGYDTYYLTPAQDWPPSPEFAGATTPQLENETLVVTADPSRGGGLSSILLKPAKKEFVRAAAGVANELVALTEQPDREMAPWELYTTGEIFRTSAYPAQVEALRGPVFSTLRATTTLPGRGLLIQETTLYRGLGRIDLRTTLRDYEGLHELLALTFPVDLAGASATFEDRFSTVLRRKSLGVMDFRTHWEANLSHCGLGAAQNWVEVGPAPSLHITSKGRSVGAMPLGPCVIVTTEHPAARAAAQTVMVALLRRGLTCSHRLDTDDPEGDPAACAFRLVLGRRNAYAATILVGTSHASERLEQAVAQGPWGGIVLRRPDPSGTWPEVPVLVADTADPAGWPKLAALLAEEIAQDRLAVPESHDFSGLAQPVVSHGLALLNRGALAVSLENDDTLVSLLTHTSSWSDYPWGEGMLDQYLIPEHRTHVFEHALLPHAGDWREAGLVRAGMEANHPLRTVQVPLQESVLAPTFSLLKTDAPNVAVTALKPIGAPLAEKRIGDHSSPDKGVLVRLYETHGMSVDVSVACASAPAAAWETDLLERKTGEVELAKPRWGRPAEIKVPVGACEVTSLAMILAPLAEPGPPSELGPSAEPQMPGYVRYWDHNAGAAPLGNMPVSLWTRGPLPLGQNTRFPLGINNETTDREITGVIQMIAPPEWTMIPRQLPYRIAPNTAALYEVMVIVPPEAAPCYVRAITKQDGYEVQDVIPVGEVAPLEGSLARTVGGFTVSVNNPNADYVEGEMTLITPLESWGALVDGSAVGAVTPRSYPFRLEAGEKQEFTFTAEGEPPAWAVAKVAWYGNVIYLQA